MRRENEKKFRNERYGNGRKKDEVHNKKKRKMQVWEE